MGLICYVLYLPVKKLAYYLNTGSPQPPFLPSVPGNSGSSFFHFPFATLQDSPFPLSSPLARSTRKQQQGFLNDSMKGKLLNTFHVSNVNAYRSTMFLQFRPSTPQLDRFRSDPRFSFAAKFSISRLEEIFINSFRKFTHKRYFLERRG